MNIRKIIYVTLLVLFMITMFSMPFVYIAIRLHHDID